MGDSTVPLGYAKSSMSEEDFRLLRDFIYENSGIYFSDAKKDLLENRLSLRLKANNLKDYQEYYYMLRYGPQQSREIKALFDSVSTNETSFFRSPPQIQALQDYALIDVVKKRLERGENILRMWSAGCSTGEEPYTMAIVVKEFLKERLSEWDVKILASDISERALSSARRAEYNAYSLRSMPDLLKYKYFDNSGNTYKVKDEIKKLVELQYLNFVDSKRVSLMQGFDIVFCRNVLIYFDDALRKRFVSQLYDSLIPGGYLFIGHSESLHNITRAFKLVHFPGALAYKKE